MSNKNIIFSFIIIVAFSSINLYSQQEPAKLETIKNAYQRIIHLSPNDYIIQKEAEGNPGSGIRGLFAGNKYLLVWDIANIYVFDIATYQKIATLKPSVALKDVVESQGKIYCLSGSILVYDTFNGYKVYRFNSQFTNPANYKSFLAQNKLRNFPDPEKMSKSLRYRRNTTPAEIEQEVQKLKLQKERLEYYSSLNGRMEWRKASIWGLPVINNEAYLNVDFNLLKFNEDFTIEEDDIFNMNGNTYFMTLKHEVQERTYYDPVGDHLIKFKRIPQQGYAIIDLEICDMNYNNIKKEKIKIPYHDEKGKLATIIPITYLNKCLFYLGGWRSPKNIDYTDISILALNIDTKKIINIEMPHLPGTPFITNYNKYSSYSNNNIYAVTYNRDTSVDIVKVEVKLP